MPNMRHHFSALLTRINPPDDRVETAASRVNELRDYLTEHDFPTTSPDTRLSGSYSRHTAIERIQDVDVLVFVPRSQLDRTPNAVLIELHGVLKDFPGGAIDTRGQRRSVRITLEADDLHLDVVPSVLDGDLSRPIRVPDRHQETWIRSDPLGYAERLSGLNKEHGGKLVPLIKLFKAWRDEQMKRRRPKSYVLEVILLEGVQDGDLVLCDRGVAENVYDAFVYITDRFEELMDEGKEAPRVSDPQVPSNLITKGWHRAAFETFMTRAREARRAAKRALEGEDEIKSSEEWQRVFGSKWPEESDVKEAARAEAQAVRPGESSITAGGLIIAGALGVAAVSLAKRRRGHTAHSIPRGIVMRGRVPRERDFPTRQLRGMRQAFPQFVPTLSRGGGIMWNGTLQPTAESPLYHITIAHPFDRNPAVRVAKPAIRPASPHRYRDGSLCLYWPREWRWSPRESLADTLVPWTVFWLYYYEIWLVTEQWLGPCSPHGADLSKEAS